MQGKQTLLIVSLPIALALVIPLLALVQQPGAISLPEGDGKELVSTSCVGCHSLERTLSQGRSAEGWEETVNGMVSRGAQILSADAEIIIDYLAEHFGVDYVPPREQRVMVWVDRQGKVDPLPVPPSTTTYRGSHRTLSRSPWRSTGRSRTSGSMTFPQGS